MMGSSAVFEPVQAALRRRAATRARAEPPRMTPARKRALEIAADGLVRAKSALAAEAGCSTGVIDGLVEAGALVEVAIPERRLPRPQPGPRRRSSSATPRPRAAHAMRAAADARRLLRHAARRRHRLRQDRGLLRGRGAHPGEGAPGADHAAGDRAHQPVHGPLHGAASAARRSSGTPRCPRPSARRAWRAAATGEARVVVGARSALFLPYSDLGLIVVDEEHDGGFKQEDRVHYQARDMAVVRGSLGKFPVVLASATPSIESHVNARTGRYALRRAARPLLRRRAARGRDHRPAPASARDAASGCRRSLVDGHHRDARPRSSRRCCSSTAAATRRSRCAAPAATASTARSARPGWSSTATATGSTATTAASRCRCPRSAPSAATPDALVACGPGVERIAEEVAERFPEARVALLSSDLVPSLIEMREIIKTIEAGEADIIIGTQMVAKGHHFPQLATVGVVDGDLGLGQADPRAAERTFQLLHQVTGRAGRVLTAGRGFVQTYMPEHPVMQAIISGDREAFLDARDPPAPVGACCRPTAGSPR